MQAMILAAGFGTRLLPHTRIRPKALFPLLNRPLLLLTIERFLAAGFDHIIVNCHHLAEQIEVAVANFPQVILQKEESILGTGGSLQQAWETGLLRDEPLLISNGDIYHTLDLRKFYCFHQVNSFDITLVMHNYSRFNNVYCTDDEIVGFDKVHSTGTIRERAFTGLHCIQPHILRQAPVGFSSIINFYKTILGKGKKIGCYHADYEDNFYWKDIGTPKDYLELHGELLEGAVPRISELDKPISNVLCETEENDAIFTGWAAIGKASLGENCHICRSVIWDGVELLSGTTCCDTILSGVQKNS